MQKKTSFRPHDTIALSVNMLNSCSCIYNDTIDGQFSTFRSNFPVLFIRIMFARYIVTIRAKASQTNVRRPSQRVHKSNVDLCRRTLATFLSNEFPSGRWLCALRIDAGFSLSKLISTRPLASDTFLSFVCFCSLVDIGVHGARGGRIASEVD